MSWITIVWSMNAAACLTLAGIYLLVLEHFLTNAFPFGFSFWPRGYYSPCCAPDRFLRNGGLQ
jgi:hypothetical protein